MKLQRYDIYGGDTDLDGTNIDLTHPDDNGRWVYANDAMKAIADRDAEIARLKHILNDRSTGIHSCSHLCERPLCVMGRENRRLRAELNAAKAVVEKMSPDAQAFAVEWWRVKEMMDTWDFEGLIPHSGCGEPNSLWEARFLDGSPEVPRPESRYGPTPAAAIIAAHEAWQKET